jgi:hypothetical protein
MEPGNMDISMMQGSRWSSQIPALEIKIFYIYSYFKAKNGKESSDGKSTCRLYIEWSWKSFQGEEKKATPAVQHELLFDSYVEFNEDDM